ncbi:unnamed protein product [Penicillium bialowiezense]
MSRDLFNLQRSPRGQVYPRVMSFRLLTPCAPDTSEEPHEALQRKIDKCRETLFLTDPQVDREALRSTKGQRTIGTCEWIRDNETYKSWVHGDLRSLWISGGPGKGKTMISIFISEELERVAADTTDMTTLFYFCSHQDEKRNNATAVLRSLLHQYLTKRRDFFKHVSSYFEDAKKEELTLSSPDALWIILKTLLQADHGTAFFIVDGLDECDEESIRFLVSKVSELFSTENIKETNGRFRCALISRRIVGLEVFSQLKLDDPDKQNFTISDIQRFISVSVQILGTIEGFSEIRKTVEDTLLQNAEGTFLWVSFVIKELSTKSTCIEIIDLLDDIPSGLPGIYSRMLRQTESNRQPIMFKILRLVVVAARPLTVQELAAVFSMQPVGCLSSEQVMRDHILLCGYILEIYEQQVRLVHQSARDYLLRQNFKHDPILERFREKVHEAHPELTEICLDCIENSHLRFEISNAQDSSVLQENPLLQYAILHWPEHARQHSSYTSGNWNLRRPFFQEPSVVRRNWRKVYGEYSRALFILGDDKSPLLHTACLLGIGSLARKLLCKRAYLLKFHKLRKLVNQKDGAGNSPLGYAAYGGHTDIVKLLLERKANVDALQLLQRTPLFFATKRDNEATVKLLLENGADPNFKDCLDETVLGCAADMGNETILKLLIEWGANVDQRNYRGETALIIAVQKEHGHLVESLLEAGADIEISDKAGRITSEMGDEQFEESLEWRDIYIEIYQSDKYTMEYGMTALSWAIKKGNEAIVKQLLDKGAVPQNLGTEMPGPLVLS